MLAQLVEQPPCKRQVVGAEPTHGSMSGNLWKKYFSRSLNEWSKVYIVYTALLRKKQIEHMFYFYFDENYQYESCITLIKHFMLKLDK